MVLGPSCVGVVCYCLLLLSLLALSIVIVVLAAAFVCAVAAVVWCCRSAFVALVSLLLMLVRLLLGIYMESSLLKVVVLELDVAVAVAAGCCSYSDMCQAVFDGASGIICGLSWPFELMHLLSVRLFILCDRHLLL